MNESNDSAMLTDDGENLTESELKAITRPIVSRKQAIERGLTRYYNGRMCKNGHRSERLVSNHGCLVCATAAGKRYLETEWGRRRKRATDKKAYDRRPAYYLWVNCRNRAKKRGLDFSIEESDVVIPAICPVLGIPIENGPKGFHPNSPSVDRFIPEAGYTKENIRVISMRANKLKSDATLEEIEAVLKYMKGEL